MIIVPIVHPLRGDGDGRQRDPRVGERLERVVPEVVPDEDAVPPGVLRRHRHLGDDARIGELLGQ